MYMLLIPPLESSGNIKNTVMQDKWFYYTLVIELKFGLILTHRWDGWYACLFYGMLTFVGLFNAEVSFLQAIIPIQQKSFKSNYSFK